MARLNRLITPSIFLGAVIHVAMLGTAAFGDDPFVYEGVPYTAIANGSPNGLTARINSVDGTALNGLTGQTSTTVGLAGNSTSSNPAGATYIPNGWGIYNNTANLGALTGSLSYPQAGDSALPTVGNRIVAPSGASSINRRLSQPVGDINGANTIYWSGLMNSGAALTHFAVFDLQNLNNTGPTVTPRLEIGGWGGPGASFKQIAGNPIGYSSPTNAVAATTYLYVGKIQFTGDGNQDTITYWINPTLSNPESSNTAVASGLYGTVGNQNNYDSLVIYQYDASTEYDELKLSSTWEGLTLAPVPVPEPGTVGLLAAAGGLVGLCWFRRRR